MERNMKYMHKDLKNHITVILSLLQSTGNNVQASFWAHQVPRTSATVLWYCQVFSFCIWVPDYTCYPMIVNISHLATNAPPNSATHKVGFNLWVHVEK